MCACSGFDSSPLQDKTQKSLDGLLDFLSTRLNDCSCLELNIYEGFVCNVLEETVIPDVMEETVIPDVSYQVVQGMAQRIYNPERSAPYIHVSSLQMSLESDQDIDKLKVLDGKHVTIDELAIVVVKYFDEKAVQLVLDSHTDDGPAVIVSYNGAVHIPNGNMDVDGSGYTHNQV